MTRTVAYLEEVTAKLQQREQRAARAKQTIAGFKPDVALAEDRDLLDITSEVEVLCSVLAAKDVKPPISVGLFGDWGSGKTFFMQKMQQQFESIGKRAKDVPETAYCRNIVQLWFNAWHYTDANLWASLVSHIFEELAKAISPENDEEQSKTRLLRELNTAKELLAEAIREKTRAVQQREQTEEELRRLAQTRAETEAQLANLKLPDLQQLLDGEPELKKELQTNLTALGLPAAMDSLSGLESVLRDAYGLSGRLRAVVLTVWRSEERGVQLVLLVIVLAGFPLLTYLMRFWLPQHWVFTRAGTIWGEFTVVVSSLTVVLRKYVGIGSQYLAELEAKLQRVKAVLEEKRKEKTGEQLALEKRLNEIKAKETGASKQFSEAQQRVRQIEERIKEIDEGRSLSRFILERVQADDYRQYLGIISTIRRDFEQLDKLLPLGGTDGRSPALVPIERIILYIDDLDRCPEDKVVEVLQAIHLLLAFRLFVVGVDSRWLLHSLRQHSSVFRESDAASDNTGDVDHWRSTPLNYLEKIFQIPFALRPMPRDGFRRLIDSLTEQQLPKREAQGVATIVAKPVNSEEIPEKPRAAVPSDSEGTTETPVQLAAVNVAVFDPNPEPLQLKDCERHFMLHFQAFIPSPRAAKRFVNVYRLLRAAVKPQELATFVRDDGSGEYQAVQWLLAIQTGYPEQAAQIVRDLISQRPTMSWQAFLQAYASGPSHQSDAGAGTPQSGTPLHPQSDRWRELLERLRSLNSDAFPERFCDEFIKWGPRVARYSFQAARVLQFDLTEP